MEILAADSPAQIEQVRGLFQEYWDSFGFSPCFQNFGDELAGLPGDYAPPGGFLALALVDGEPAACGALRQFDATRCEAKRLYARPAFRGTGLGRTVLLRLVDEARRLGYRELVGDTMPVMERALTLYDRMGFERSEPYGPHPTPGAIYLRLRL